MKKKLQAAYNVNNSIWLQRRISNSVTKTVS